MHEMYVFLITANVRSMQQPMLLVYRGSSFNSSLSDYTDSRTVFLLYEFCAITVQMQSCFTVICTSVHLHDKWVCASIGYLFSFELALHIGRTKRLILKLGYLQFSVLQNVRPPYQQTTDINLRLQGNYAHSQMASWPSSRTVFHIHQSA